MVEYPNQEIANIFENYPVDIRENLCFIRNLIFDEAQRNNVGVLKESLKWGQPSYASSSKSATPIRLGLAASDGADFGLFVHCQTSLIEHIRHLYPGEFRYGGNRAILFAQEDHINEVALRHFISMALTYHLKK